MKTIQCGAACIQMSQNASLQDRYLVLVVEDEILIRLLACEVLADAGFDVVETQHADEAVAVLHARGQDVHAVFTDIHMPGSMDGLELAHLSRRKCPWVALLIASGRARPQSEELPEGSRFLSKPYDLDHVVAHLQEMIAA